MAVGSELIFPFYNVLYDFGPLDFAGQLLNLAFKEKKNIMLYTHQHSDMMQYDLHNVRNNRKVDFQSKIKSRYRLRRSKRPKRTGNMESSIIPDSNSL